MVATPPQRSPRQRLCRNGSLGFGVIADNLIDIGRVTEQAAAP
jgi:hypothetical protein